MRGTLLREFQGPTVRRIDDAMHLDPGHAGRRFPVEAVEIGGKTHAVKVRPPLERIVSSGVWTVSPSPGMRSARSIILLAVLGGLALPATGQSIRPPELRQEFHRAERAWRTGTNLYEAKIRLDRVLKAVPDDAEARLVRARVLLDLDRPSEALADARAATRITPGDGRAWLVRAEAAQRGEGDREEAFDALDRAAERITDGIDEHVRLSWVAQALSEIDRAEAFARIALALGPDAPAAYWRLAEVFVAQERFGDAETLLARGLEDGVLSGSSLRAHPVLGPLADAPALRAHLDG